MIRLELNNVSFWYDSPHKKVIEEFTWDIDSPSSIALIGINGSGKTSILRIIAGFMTPKIGEIIINRKHVKGVKSTKNLVTYVPENARLFLIGPTPRKDLLRIIKDENTVDKVFKRHNIEFLADKKLYQMSEGQRRLIALIISFQTSSKILLFDEPTIGLDNNGRYLFFQLLKNAKLEGKLIIVATNDNRILTQMDNILVLKDSRFYLYGSPNRILYQLEEKTDLIPNQTVRLIQSVEKVIGKEIPHFLTIDELNKSIREMKQ